jgi:5-methylcytosine-specific restriction protein A
MAIPTVRSSSSILQAIREFDELGREKFLASHGYGPAHSYFLHHEGKRYDSKAILGVACGYEAGAEGPFPSNKFSGGEEPVARMLRKLGFRVEKEQAKNPDWTRDELILALDLYFREPSARGNKSHPEIVKLSRLLNSLQIHGPAGRDAEFRNPSGVAMKLSNFLSFDPDYKGKGLSRGSQLEGEVWKTFANDRSRLGQVAAAIMENMDSPASIDNDADDGDEEAEEGRVLTRAHRSRERNRQLVEKKKQRVLLAMGRLTCEACGFDYEAKYGSLGTGYAECHHTKPVSELKPGENTKLSDLVILCANCHRMVHRRRPWPTLEELRSIVRG